MKNDKTSTMNGYFSSYEQAEMAATKLRTIGISSIAMNQGEGYFNAADYSYTPYSLSGLPGYFPGLNMGTGFPVFGAGLWAPYAFGAPDPDEAISVGSDRPAFVLEIQTPDSQRAEVRSIIEQCGGSV